MGKINLTWHASLDGVASDQEKWMDMPDAVIEDSLLYYDTVDALLIGGHTYEGVADYWLKAETESASDVERFAGVGEKVFEKMHLQKLEAGRTETFPGGLVATWYEKKQ